MITFRAQHEECPEWDTISIDGENEDLLAHAIAKQLRDAGWEVVTNEGWDDE